MSRRAWIAGVIVTIALAAAPAVAGGGGSVAWQVRTPVSGPQDIAGPLADGRFVVAAGGPAVLALSLYDPVAGTLRPFARGPQGYSSDTAEPYIAMAREGFRGPRGCSFGRDATYAIESGADAGVIRISRRGIASRFASFSGFPSGITFDRGGAFGHRLLVAVQGAPSVVYGFDCDGEQRTIVADSPRIEGGMTTAPRTFGDFGRELIAVDEVPGLIYAFSPAGEARVVAASQITAGFDIGVESPGFVPGLRRGGMALLGDPGRDAILSIGAEELSNAGIRGGDLLIAAEGPPTETIAVRCSATCAVRAVGVGPAGDGHAEGHIKFVRGVR